MLLPAQDAPKMPNLFLNTPGKVITKHPKSRQQFLLATPSVRVRGADGEESCCVGWGKMWEMHENTRRMKREYGLWRITSRCSKHMDMDFHQNILMHPIGFQWVSSKTPWWQHFPASLGGTWFRAGGVASRLGVQRFWFSWWNRWRFLPVIRIGVIQS